MNLIVKCYLIMYTVLDWGFSGTDLKHVYLFEHLYTLSMSAFTHKHKKGTQHSILGVSALLFDSGEDEL